MIRKIGNCIIPCGGGVPARTVLGIMMFWSVVSAFLLRVNLSLGIVAMVIPSYNSSRDCITNITICREELGEFYWSETTQGTILSAFFWGYLILQLPGGRLSELIGGRRVMGFALLSASLLSAVTPPLARVHHNLLVAVRALQGLVLGVQFPTIATIVARWVPLKERARFCSIFVMGGSLGLAFIMPLCGLVITYLGWPALFYLSAAQGILFTTVWFLLVHDVPDMHPRISLSEVHYIKRGLVAGPVKTIPVPWRQILSSLQMWAPFVAAVGSDWGFYTLLTVGPKYMASILGVNMQQNGVLSSLPFLCRYLFGIVVAQVLDYCLRRKFLTLVQMRRCAVCISHLLPALVLVAFPLVSNDVAPAVTLLCIAMACNGALTSGHTQSSVDIAPNFSGTLGGFHNGLCSLTGVLSPILIAFILERDPTVTGWRIAFAVSAIIYASSSVLFLFVYKAQVQPWNDLNRNSTANIHESQKAKSENVTELMAISSDQ